MEATRFILSLNVVVEAKSEDEASMVLSAPLRGSLTARSSTSLRRIRLGTDPGRCREKGGAICG